MVERNFFWGKTNWKEVSQSVWAVGDTLWRLQYTSYSNLNLLAKMNNAPRYCKSLKYSGNNKIAIIFFAHMR